MVILIARIGRPRVVGQTISDAFAMVLERDELRFDIRNGGGSSVQKRATFERRQAP